MENNYQKVPLHEVPDCCGVCQFGDIDGKGCETLSGILCDEEALDVSFNFFHVCDEFERTSQDGYDSYWPVNGASLPYRPVS
ncbi:hypothetical protein LCGC14_1518330 [marine sediment metagenome]|uniref:Uncharacterized protein n=1 Tax=marine sediment metagenome TaxID=412755 RepID=A0A0F9IZN5_9ZZZZ